MKKENICAGFVTVLLFAAGSINAAEIPCEYDSNGEWPQPEGKVCQSEDTLLPAPLLANDDSGTPPACSSTAFDSDGDGWGWENNASCQVLFVNGVAVCESASSDPDGDGWGWENNRTCSASAVASRSSGTRVCDFRSSDSDGDGWGWENGASCQVSAASAFSNIPITPTLTTNTPAAKAPTNSTQVTNPPVSNPPAASPSASNASVPAPRVEHPSCLFRASDDNADGWGYENEKTCRITETSRYPECFGVVADTDPDGDGWGFQNNRVCQVVAAKEFKGVVFEQNFESASLGAYGASEVNQDWQTPIWHLGFSQRRANIVADAERGKSLRVTYPGNKYGAAGAAAFLSDVKFGVDLPASYEELYVSYDMKFAAGFDFVRGGKLPGLCGYDNTKSATSGCNTGGGFPDGFDGWSARGMWREGGKLENYVYHANQVSFFGDDEFWGVNAQPGQWHRVQHRVVMNTPGVADGILEAWIDGVKVLSLQQYMFRKTANIGINLFYFSTFYGGADISWAPSTDQYAFFDNFRIATDSEVFNTGKALTLSDDLSDDLGDDLSNEVSNSDSSSRSSGGGATTTLFIVFLLSLVALKRRFLILR